MPFNALLAFAAAVLCAGIGIFALLEDRRSLVQRIFALGMGVLGLEALFIGLSAQSVLPLEVVFWQRLRFIVAAFLPGAWLVFSLSFARANYKEFLSKWRWVIAAVFVCPVALSTVFRKQFFMLPLSSELSASLIPLGWSGYAFHLWLLSSVVLIMINLEKTLRAAVGSKRWQIKFMSLGVGSLLAIQVYTSSQALLFSALNSELDTIYSGAIIVADVLIIASLARARLLKLDIYLSQGFLYGSITAIAVGLYLIAVGLVAKAVSYIGGSKALLLTDFLIFLALVGLTIVLLTQELRQRAKSFILRNLKRPQYDYRKEWLRFTERTTSLTDIKYLCATVANIVAETFGTPSVSIWLLGKSPGEVVLGGSTAFSNGRSQSLEGLEKGTAALIRAMSGQGTPVDFGVSDADWPGEIQRDYPTYFREGQIRYCTPLNAGQQMLGVITASDRVGGVPFSVQDLDLLKTFADQAAAALLNRKLSEDLVRAKEMEAFQTMSAFFVHDLKNVASMFSVTIGNLRAYFDDPAFRSDALRTMSQSVEKINGMCARLSLLSRKPEIRLLQTDLNELVTSVFADLNGSLKATVINRLESVPQVVIDPEQMKRVLINLVLNANDAAGDRGEIQIATERQNGCVRVSISDNGPGMSREFIANSLFRPFQSSKKNGLGIGLFLSKKIVEAQQGRIEVESEEGRGSRFSIVLPIASKVQVKAEVE
jgi:putative PEP-CTERM system histidine kinase